MGPIGGHLRACIDLAFLREPQLWPGGSCESCPQPIAHAQTVRTSVSTSPDVKEGVRKQIQRGSLSFFSPRKPVGAGWGNQSRPAATWGNRRGEDYTSSGGGLGQTHIPMKPHRTPLPHDSQIKMECRIIETLLNCLGAFCQYINDSLNTLGLINQTLID